jgi:hypothetical protein
VTPAISIDLETLKARYDAAILSIGAASVDLDTGKLGDTFYREITLSSAMKAGSISPDTLEWWIGQSDKAKRVFTGQGAKTPLSVALDDLRTWIMKHPKATVWGNGSSFDITILEYAYDHGCVGLKEPWAFWDIRDMRTIVDVAGLDKRDVQMSGVAHNALDDAVHQAKVISMAWRKVRGSLGLLPAAKSTSRVPVTAAVEDDEL